MVLRIFLLLLFIVVAGSASAQDGEGELAKVKERELEQVRERISDLKQSMDRAALAYLSFHPLGHKRSRILPPEAYSRPWSR